MHISSISTFLITLSFCAMSFVIEPAAQAFAQESSQGAAIVAPVDIMPATKARERGISYDNDTHTHPAIKLTPDKSELVRLDQPANSILIGNPNHLSILADTSKTLVLVPRAPGATHFTVLDAKGAVLMQRHVIVASPKEKYLRVRRSCAGSGSDECQPTSVFYCPDMCHEIILNNGESESNAEALEGMEGTTAQQEQNGGPNAQPPQNTDTE